LRSFLLFSHGARAGREKGSATIWVISLTALVWFVAGILLAAGSSRVARHRAQAAADLSALAGAVHALAAPARACREARALATANHAALTRCDVHTGVIQVRVVVRSHLPVLGPKIVTADARAGPQ
jgi:secretion/DNA translocation related TadE-like protein